MKVSIYTDGAARGNPDGPGGYGVVLEYVDPKGELHVNELSGGYVGQCFILQTRRGCFMSGSFPPDM